MTKKQTHIPYGFITGLAMIVVGVIFQVMKMSTTPWAQWLPMVVLLTGVILNAQAFSKANDADITFGQAFGSCFKATAIIAIVMVAWSFIALLIFPQIYTQAMEKIQTDMDGKHVSEEQADMAINMTKKYFKVFMVAGALFGTLLAGALASLIGAAVAKKSPRPQFDAR